jgi:hypothetical protein
MSPRTGRPKIDNPKRNQTKIRTTDEELEKIEYCAKKLGISKTEVILKGVDMVYTELIGKEK